MDNIIKPDWPAPASVHAVSTTRLGGVSEGVFGSMNLALHVGDEESHVLENRSRLKENLSLPAEPVWLSQVHGTDVVDLDDCNGDFAGLEGDGSCTGVRGRVCVVMTADCLPVLLCNQAGDRVAALHAGWRGLADGVLEAGVRALRVPGQEVLAWLGPAIGAGQFEVGTEVRQVFVDQHEDAAGGFVARGHGKFLADLYYLGRLRLQAMGVRQIFGGGWCTYEDAASFYSYRRDGRSGRMASLIWLG